MIFPPTLYVQDSGQRSLVMVHQQINQILDNSLYRTAIATYETNSSEKTSKLSCVFCGLPDFNNVCKFYYREENAFGQNGPEGISI